MNAFYRSEILRVCELRLTRIIVLVGLFLFLPEKTRGQFELNPSASPNSVCSGSEVQLIAGASGGSGSYTYTWTSDPEGFTSDLANPVVYPLVNTTYSISVYDGSSTLKSFVTVTVKALPVVTFSAQPGMSACLGSNVTYTTEALMTNYVWVLSGTEGIDYSIISGGTANDNSITLVYLTTGNRIVTVNYINSDGCTASSPASSTETTIYSLPETSLIWHN